MQKLGGFEYTKAAERAISFIDKNLIVDGPLMVQYRVGETANKGFLDDYAYMLWANIERYECTLHLDYFKRAKTVNGRYTKAILDEENGGFFFYGEDHEELLIRPKDAYDGAQPSGNSVAAM